MKKTILAFFLLSLMFILSACVPFFDKKTDQDLGPNDSASNATSSKVAESQDNNQIPEQKEIKKFYPDALSQPSATKPAAEAASDALPQNLEIKLYLVDKYNPGTCYGMPSPVTEESINGMIARNKSLSALVKEKYKLKSDLEIYMKLKQIFGIQIEPVSGGKYEYDFIDGQCCSLNSYIGQIENIGGKISDTVTNQETKNNPC